jgi:hypothetical protein
MKGDFSRQIFDPKKHNRSVLMQQGRVQLDADWNEQADINVYHDETRMLDLTGGCGGPLHNAAFQITPVSGQADFQLSAGRYYVDGILCENELKNGIQRTLLDQPDFPPNKVGLIVLKTGVYVAYLDVWQRHLTAIDDPGIREVALGGPDATTRVKTIWQVKLLFVGANPLNPNCLSDFTNYNSETAQPTGTLQALQAPPKDAGENLCIVPPGAGYQGLENQLYRVEIHKGGSLGTATFKWSRENGSVVTTIEKIKGAAITVRDIGPDGVLGFAQDQWVEIIDDVKELNGERGELRQIKDVDPAQRIITLKTTATALASSTDGVDPKRHPKLRRWDYGGTVDAENALLAASTALDLEYGVQVKFSTGNYRTGDYWLIPARTASADAQSGNIEWPLNPTDNQPLALPPFGIKHHYCRIALLKYNGTQFSLLQDCRSLFPPVTELNQLFYVSGDGQEVMPDVTNSTTLKPLPLPIVVGVSNGRWPVKDAKVRFDVPRGRVAPGTDGTPQTQTDVKFIDVMTNANGLASCNWQLISDSAFLVQTLRARLLDANDQTVHLPINFNANLSLASQVAYVPGECSDLQETRTVQEALDLLCLRKQVGSCSVIVGEKGEFKTLLEALQELLFNRKQFDICICMLPGDHIVELIQLVVIAGSVAMNGRTLTLPQDRRPRVQIKIEGCGVGTRLHWRAGDVSGAPPATQLRAFSLFSGISFTMRDLEVNVETGSILFDNNTDVTLEFCTIFQKRVASNEEMKALTGYGTVTQPFLSLLFFSACQHIRIENCRISQLMQTISLQTYEVFVDLHPPLAGLYAESNAQTFGKLATGVAQDIQRSPSLERTSLADKLKAAIVDFEPATREKFATLATAVQQGQLSANTLTPLRNINISLVRETPGTAIVLNDGVGNVTIHNNTIEGVLCLYGITPSAWIDLDKNGAASPFSTGLIQISNLGKNLSVRNNQLTRVAISRTMMNTIVSSSTGPAASGVINNVFRNAFFGDNDLTSPINQFMARHLSLSSNVLTKLAMNQTPSVFISHVAVGHSGIYVGNYGSEGKTRLRSATALKEQAANLNLVIV